MKKNSKKIITFIAVSILIVVAIYTKNDKIIEYVEENYNIDLKIAVSGETEKTNKDSSLIKCDVVRVVDGDTIIVNYNGNEEKIRLIGIDTPESVHPNKSKNTNEGILTANYTKQRLNGKKVEIELDVQERDKYGRVLAYVYIEGQMYNKELLKLGYAKLATYPPNVKYVDEFKKIQDEAKKQKLGMWS